MSIVENSIDFSVRWLEVLRRNCKNVARFISQNQLLLKSNTNLTQIWSMLAKFSIELRILISKTFGCCRNFIRKISTNCNQLQCTLKLYNWLGTVEWGQCPVPYFYEPEWKAQVLGIVHFCQIFHWVKLIKMLVVFEYLIINKFLGILLKPPGLKL